MPLPTAFLDELRERVSLSGVIARTLKLERAGREFRACCPFHGEKTPSFTVSDAKHFAHCFGCGWHGDVFRWLQDAGGLDFLDAVREMAGMAGMEMPARDASAEARAQRVETARGALDAAQAIYRRQLGEAGAVMEYLAGRGIGPAEIEAFGLGYARAGAGSLRGAGIGEKAAIEAGLIARRDDGSLREMFHDRITVPIHDARGRLCGFGARVWPGPSTGSGLPGKRPKFLNSPDGPLFDKGRTLFNLHRAADAARPAGPLRPDGEGRLVVVEGYFDVIALARAGVRAAVAPMGTALTAPQIERLWRLHHRPVLLFDGDAAGRRAALRAAKLALALAGPGRELAVALLPAGQDPDDAVRAGGQEGGAQAITAALAAARPLHDVLFEAVTTGELV